MANSRTVLPLLEVLSITRALSDESRTRTLMALRKQELCVCQIVELLELAPSTVSKHVSILKQAGLVESRRDGRWTFYRRALPGGETIVDRALVWLDSSLSQDPVVEEDEQRLKRILKVSSDELCRRKGRT
jgi:DNA-binding transcriptional ArsR family regulator